MANTCYVHIRDVREAAQVPNAASGAVAVVRFSAACLTPGGARVGNNTGSPITDTTNVAINGGDLVATVQSRITTLLQGASYFNDGTLSVLFL